MNIVNKLAVKLGMIDKIETDHTAKLKDGKEIFLSEEAVAEDVVVKDSEGLLADGDYTLEDGTEFSVKDGVANTVKEVEVEANTDYFTKDDAMQMAGELEKLVNEAIEAKFQSLSKQIQKTPQAKPATQAKPTVDVNLKKTDTNYWYNKFNA